MAGNVFIIEHPLAQHKLTLMRRKETSTGEFRLLVREISPFMLYEVTRDLPLTEREIETPLQRMRAPVLAGKKLCLVPILRAGLGFVDAMLDLVPAARVGHIGLYRDPDTLVAVEYYMKMPDDIAARLVIVVDPMLATGHSATAALTRLKEAGAENIKFVCLVAAPSGLEVVQAEHPDVPIFTVAIDERLNEHAYILPGLGDAGDRLFGTK
ncbi:MAG: uracil phosphoribosyltransferase [Alphaproteobacteria bacterium]